MKRNDENHTDLSARTNVVPFDSARAASKGRASTKQPRVSTEAASDHDLNVAAVVTVTRFIGGKRVHAQIPVYTRELHFEDAADRKLVPELSELLADGAVEANSFLDRLAAVNAAQPFAQFVR